jgi:hypothetical protein
MAKYVPFLLVYIAGVFSCGHVDGPAVVSTVGKLASSLGFWSNGDFNVPNQYQSECAENESLGSPEC